MKRVRYVVNMYLKINKVNIGGMIFILLSCMNQKATESSETMNQMAIALPYPHSDLIRSVVFEPVDSILRLAEGCDNWPVTWADDDKLYTAYGDGWGFEPKVEKKLSLGLASIEGNPPNLSGHNIRSESGEKVGQGKYGVKASGMLMVDNTLYMLVRNAGDSQLGWSDNYGDSWTWSNWKFDTSFGCPTFLNYGKNNDGAIDSYVYIYSHDANSAYDNADQFVLARVKKDEIKDLDQYSYFVGLDVDNTPVWNKQIEERQSVFSNKGNCYRSGITYNSGLKRFIWFQTLPHTSHPDGVRFDGGFGIFESSNPWGPWNTVYYTKKWDVGPGETSLLPTKWISKDGTQGYMLFSGDDYLSVRGIKFIIND